MNKKYKLSPGEIEPLIPTIGGCMATDMITVQGENVGYMYREGPSFRNDSGWRFFSGTETQAYVDNHENWAIYDTNTIANYDSAIIPYLGHPVGSELERTVKTDKFLLLVP